jgi:hypothetical protein
MKKPLIKTCFLILSLILLCVTPAGSEETSYLYKAVVKSTVAGVYQVANWRTPLLTQALLNEEIEVLSTSGIYVFARVPDGYSGYLRQTDITDDLSSINAAGDKVIVKSNFAAVSDSLGREIIIAPMSSVFFGRRDGNKYIITLPQNVIGYINAEDVLFLQRNERIPLGDGKKFADTAMLLMGVNYLWGGCSINGIDCSGLTYIAAKMNGLTIPRDSQPQSLVGVTVDLADAVIGDQLFFSSDNRKLTVSHTGIYLGNGDFVHSSGSLGVAVTNIYTSEYYKERFMFAKSRF